MHHTHLPATFLCCAFLSMAGRADSLDEALALVPPEADAAFVVPSLKRASDDLQACLERADRPETQLLGRPLDLLKSQLGVSVGVRDDGSVVGLARWTGEAGEPTLTLLVPVSDAAAFLNDNFERGADAEPVGGQPVLPRTVRRADSTLFVAEVTDGSRRWVALSPTAAGVDGLKADAARAAAHRERLGAGADRLLRGAEILAWTSGEGLRRSADARAKEALAEAPAEAAQEIQKGMERLRAVQVAATAWDIDALGIVGRGLLRIDREHEAAAPFAGGRQRPAAAPGRRLGLLPAQGFYMAMGIDIDGLGGVAALKALGDLLPGTEWLAPWVGGAQELQMAVYPSKLGVTVGGILNDAALVLRCASPSGQRDALKTRLQALQGEHEGVKRVLTWEADKAVKDSGTADAFELQQTVLPAQPGDKPAVGAAVGAADDDGDTGLVSTMVTSVLLGSRGLHGFVKPFDDRGVLVATFSQRPDVWRRAVAAATGDGPSLGTGATLAAMRGFALDDPDMEMALGLGQLVKLAQQVAKTFGADDVIPSVDAGSEPIYGSLEVDDYRVEAACVVPSAVVGLMVEQAQRNVVRPKP